jgi:hypothetical protein
MKEEKMVRLLQEAIAHGHRGRATALFTTLNNPPCILHMHNRIALKKLTVILKNGLSNALAGRLDGKLFSTGQLATLHESTKKRFDAFVKKVENLFNTEVWGTPFAPTHWNLPVDDREKKILTLCLDNERCKTAIDSFDRIIDFLLVPDNQPAAYKECVHTFRSVMVKVRQKTPFSDEDIASFQRTTDAGGERRVYELHSFAWGWSRGRHAVPPPEPLRFLEPGLGSVKHAGEASLLSPDSPWWRTTSFKSFTTHRALASTQACLHGRHRRSRPEEQA